MMASNRISVVGFDHLVLKCADVEATLAWYCDRLGLAPVRVDDWRSGTAPFPSVRVDERTIIDLIPGIGDDGRLDHFCLVVAPTDFEVLTADDQFDVVAGPGTRFGAQGVATSIYVRDPDGAVVELRYYSPG